MRTIKNLMLTGSVICAAAIAASAQDTSKTAPATDYKSIDSRSVSGESFLTKANRASSLIGMDVRNSQGEKLGDIKDLAVDLHSGKIAYAVLSVGGFLGIGEKYVAVPPSEFQLGPEGKELTLNADKARIQGAPGFARNNWPDLNSWQGHSKYWLPDGTALGTPGSAVRSGHETGGTLGSRNSGMFTGRVTAVDPASNMFTIEDAAGKRQFLVNDKSVFTLKNDTDARLAGVKVGDQITVRYHDLNGSMVVDSISDSNRIESK